MPPRPSASLPLTFLIFLANAAQAADAPPIKRVTLSTSGLADIERVGPVSGPAILSLPIALEAGDDLLKTLVIQDPASPPRAVRLPGQEPFAQEFRNLPFNYRTPIRRDSRRHADRRAAAQWRAAALSRGVERGGDRSNRSVHSDSWLLLCEAALNRQTAPNAARFDRIRSRIG